MLIDDVQGAMNEVVEFEGIIYIFQANDTEPTEPTSLGVRTRAAKTLALKRLNSSASDSALAGDSSCHLQLRIRRLEKPLARRVG